MEAYGGVRRRHGQNQNAELGTKRKGKKIIDKTTFPSTCPSVGPAAHDRGAFGSPGWGVASPLPAEPWRARSAPRHSRTRSRAIAPQIYGRGKRRALGVQGSWGSRARGEGLPD